VDNELDSLAAAASVRRDPIVQPSGGGGGIKADATLFGYLALAMFASGLVVLSVVMVSIGSNYIYTSRLRGRGKRSLFSTNAHDANYRQNYIISNYPALHLPLFTTYSLS